MPAPFVHPGFAGQIGVAHADITPPLGIYARNWGAATHDAADGVHRPLVATALSIGSNQGEEELVLITADLGWWKSAEDERYVRTAVLKSCGLEPVQLMIALSHTHAGPSLCREDADKPGGQLIAPYLDSLVATFTQIVKTARDKQEHTVLEWAYGKCVLATNRDLPDPANHRFVTGFNPDLPADDTLLVGRVSTGNRILATLVHYACHPTTLAYANRMISPDFVGVMRQTVEQATGGAPCLYLHGASGELAPRDQYTDDLAVADSNGRTLGYAALSVLSGMLLPASQLEFASLVESGASLAEWRATVNRPSEVLASELVEVELPRKPWPSLAEIELEIAAETDRALLERLHRKRRIIEGLGDGLTARMPMWVWRIGDAVLIGHPNEAYSVFQQALRDPFKTLVVAPMNVVNGHFGYLTPASLYDQELYPVWQSPFGRGALEELLREAEKAIDRLTPDLLESPR